MSYPPPPPYPPQTGPGGAYGPARAAGPGGAYGPIDTPAGQPVPGQLPPPSMTMAKPRTILGIQAILWIFSAIAAIGDLFSAWQMIELGNPIMLIALGYSVYSTIQSLMSPVQIGRGKRGFWIWNVVNAAIGTVGALVIIAITLPYIDIAPAPVLIGLVFGSLQCTLFVLLLTRSARDWIMMHHIQRGKVRSIGAPGPGAVGVLVKIPAERPEVKPAGVTLVQLMLWVVALSPLVFVPLTLVWAQDSYESASPFMRDGATSATEYMFQSDFVLGLGGAVGAAVLLAVLAIISAVGLQRGRFWARVYTPIWLGIAVLALGVGWIPGSYLLWEDLKVSSSDASVGVKTLALGVFVIGSGAFVIAVTAFITLFTRGVRTWAAGQETVISYLPGAQGKPLPGQNAAAPAPPGYGPPPPGGGYPQQYGPPQQQGYPPRY